MFIREFNVIDSAASVDQLRRRLKIEELGQYGEPFIPEFVYDAIRKLPRFASMRVRIGRLSFCPSFCLLRACVRDVFTNSACSEATSKTLRNSLASSSKVCTTNAHR